MILKSIILLCFLTIFTSCGGQHKKTTENKTQVAKTIGEPVSRLVKSIGFIFQDNQNNLWFASDGEGLFRYDGKSTLQFTERNGMCGNFVRLIEQKEGGLLSISTSKGICSFDGKQFRRILSTESRIEMPQTSKLTKSYSQNPYAVYCSYIDSKGNTWFGTESRGVCKYDGQTFTWLDNEELGLAVRAISEDKNGNIWIGNNGNGLFRYDGKTLTNITKEYKLENPDFKSTLKAKEGTLARVWTLANDKKGDLWIGTVDAGLWKYNGSTLRNYTIKDGLISNSILSVFCDNMGNLWIGTDKGVSKYDGKSFTVLEG
jgi:ligand-binding sensor domain-containing protein